MAFLDLRLMPASEEVSDCSAPARDSLATEVCFEHRTVPGAGTKRRKAAYADVLPRAGSDSFHWLKYGEKLLRDRKTLRHYYRCAARVETGCNAKKMVDVLVTSGECNWHYREAHNHPSPAGATSQPGPAPEPLSAFDQGHAVNFDLLSQGAVPGLFPFHPPNQSTPAGEDSAATLAAMLLAASGVGEATRHHRSPLPNQQPPPAAGAAEGLNRQGSSPEVMAPYQVEANSRHLHPCASALPLVAPSTQSLSPMLAQQYQQHQKQHLEALLWSDSPQVSLGSHGAPGLPSAVPLDGSLSDGDRKLPALQSQLFSIHNTGTPSPARSDLSRRGDGRRLKKEGGGSRLSKLGKGLATLSLVQPRRKRKAEGDILYNSERQTHSGNFIGLIPSLEEASVDHAEPELSQGSSCVKPDEGSNKGEGAALGAIQCCSHGSCTWLSLGQGTHHCGCYA